MKQSGGKVRIAAETLAAPALILGLLLICAPAARAKSWGETVLHSFDNADGNWSWAGLIQGSDNNFYGATRLGGANVAGEVFQLTPSGTLTTLYSFCSLGYPPAGYCPDGYFPEASLIQGRDGNFYGTTTSGGANTAGSVFQLTVSGAPPKGTLTTLYSFCSVLDPTSSYCVDGNEPVGGLIQASDGDFYGTTEGGGPNQAGTVFKLTVSGTPPTGSLTTLYTFTGGADGSNPQATLIQDSEGNFYGTTSSGGTNNGGTVFKLAVSGTPPTGSLTTLYKFCSKTGCADGHNATAGVIQGKDGNFWGTTSQGGANFGPYGYGYGTVFKLTPSGTLTTLYSFCNQTNCTDGANPRAGLIQASDGNFYGTAAVGGANWEYGNGTVFQVTPSGTLTTIYSFCSEGGVACTDGEAPYAGLFQASDGNFYGTTELGGANTECAGGGDGCGTVFELASTNASPTPTATPTAAPTSGKVTVSPASLSFGKTVEVGTTSKPKIVTIKNAGSKKTGVAVTIDSETASPSVFAVSSECEQVLEPGKSCKVSVTFSPADTTPQSGSLKIYDGAVGSPQSVGLSGTGKAPKKK